VAKRHRSTPRGEPVVQWTTRNLPASTLAELRAVASLTEVLSHPTSVEAIVNTALLVGLPIVRRGVERTIAKLPTRDSEMDHDAVLLVKRIAEARP
jgi:hypothetical protein